MGTFVKMRAPRTRAEVREWQYALSCGVRVRGKRSPSLLPHKWDDIAVSLPRNWKHRRKSRWA